jgi:hypothetical protein
MRDRRFYADLAASGDASRVFIAPPGAVKMSRRRARMPLFSPHDGICEDVRFESPFMPLNPHERDRYLAHNANRFAHARHWRHHDGPRATVVAIHGFSADLYHFNEWFFSIRWLYEAGFDVLLATLPFHGARQRCGPILGGWPVRRRHQRDQQAGAVAFATWRPGRRGAAVGVTGMSQVG